MKSRDQQRESGSALVEAAVVTPLLIMLVVSIMQFG